MLTLAITFLIIAFFAGVLGYIAVGPPGLAFFVLFFAVFLWALAQHRRGGGR